MEQKDVRYNKRSVGSKAEDMAAAYLAQQGMRIVERNYRNRSGEIDIIGYHNGYLVFVEVKYRTSLQKGNPEEAVGIAKQRVICKVGDFYRYTHRISLATAVRYDVVAVLGDEIRWHQNAFPHYYR